MVGSFSCEPTDALLASPTALRRELDRSSAPEQIADVLTLIFDAHASAATNPGDGPSLDDIVRQEMFKGVELRELCRRTATALQPEMLKGVADLLHLIGDLQAGAGTATATATTAAAAPRAPTPAAAGGARYRKRKHKQIEEVVPAECECDHKAAPSGS